MGATPQQRQNYEIIGSGQGVHWPDVDEDISAIGMLTGGPARPAKQPACIRLRPVELILVWFTKPTYFAC